MSKYKRLGINTFYVFLGNAGAKLIGLAMLPLYTKWLTVEDYGTTDIITVYVTFLLSIVSCSIAESLFIFPKGEPIEEKKEYFTSTLMFYSLTLIISAIVFFLIEYISENYNLKNSFTEYIWLIYGMIAATFFQNLMQQFCRSIDKMRIYSSTGIVLTGGTALLSFLLIPTHKITGYVLAMILANLIAGIYSFFAAGSYTYLSPKGFSNEKLKKMLRYSIPLIPNAIMWWLVSALNRPIMESYLGMHAIGLFAVANKFPGLITMLFSMFSTSWQISVLEEFHKEDYSLFYNKIFKSITTVLVFVFIIVCICSKLMVSLFATTDFYGAWKYIPILSLGVIFSNVSSLAGSNFSAVKESKYFFYSSIWGAGSAILFNFLLIPFWGIAGAATAVLLSFLTMAASRVYYSWQYVKIENPLHYLNLLILAVVMLLASLNLVGTSLWIVSGVVFITLLLLIRNDITSIFKMIKNKT